MSQVQQLLESAAGSWKSLQSDAARLAGKWTKTGLLEGLGEVEKNNMSILLENRELIIFLKKFAFMSIASARLEAT